MPGLADFLLTPFGQLRPGRFPIEPPPPPPRPPGNIPPLGQYLVPGKSIGHVEGMSSMMQQRLQSFFNNMPPDVRSGIQIGSGYRSNEHQAQLWQQALQKYGSPSAARQHVAPPGKSQHNHGNAADLHYLTPEAKAWVQANAAQHGLKFPVRGEDWHIEPSETRGGPAYAGKLNLSGGTQTAAAPASSTSSRPPPSGSVANARGAAIDPAGAMSKLQSLGYNEAQSKALVGNMVAESSLRPANYNSKEGAYGLMQWRGERFNQLQEFAQTKGTSWRDANTQLEFIKHEQTNNPYEARQSQRFLAATTVEDANAGLKSYIRYGDNSEPKRLTYAQRVQPPAGDVMKAAVTDGPLGAIENALKKNLGAQPQPQGPLAYASPAQQTAPTPAAPGLPLSDQVLGAGTLGADPYANTGGSSIKLMGTNEGGATLPGLRPSVGPNTRDDLIGFVGGRSPPGAAPAGWTPPPPERTAPPALLTVNSPSPPARPQPPAAPQAPRAPQNAPASPAPQVTGRSKLAQGIIDSWLPHPGASGGNLTTFVDSRGHEIITGSANGDSFNRDLGRTGAGQPIPQQGPAPVPAALRQAVEAATSVPLPRPRPPEAPGAPPAIGLTHPGAVQNGQKITPFDISHPGAVVWPETAGPRPGSREFSPMPSALQPAPPPSLNGGYTTTQQNPQNNMLFAPGNRLSMRDPSPNSPFAQPSPFSPAMQPPVTPPPPPPAWVPPPLQWWQQPGALGVGGFGGGFGGGSGFGMPGAGGSFDFAGGSFGGL